MSMRRGSTRSATTSPNGAGLDDSGGDFSMAGDTTTNEGNANAGPSREGSSTSDSYISQIPELDIAFLRAISAHRPLGPHKHFNLIPVLLSLDRTSRQIGARIRDRSTSAQSDEDGEGQEDDNRLGSRLTADTGAFKREEEDFEAVEVDKAMIEQRFGELFDVPGLAELEDQAVDGSEDSPFFYAPKASRGIVDAYKMFDEQENARLPPFGFASMLDKLPASSKKSSRKKKQKVEQEEEEEDAEEFELGPWEDFEAVIAPRRMKGKDDEASESEEDLSEPSIEKGNVEAEIEEEEEDGEEEQEEEEEAEEEQEEEITEMPAKRGTKRQTQAPAASSAKSRQKKAAGSETPTPRASRSAASAPRRSTRR